MIAVKKINNKEIVVNCELIQMIEGGTDTIIVLTSGEKLIVADRADEIVRKVIEYKRAIRDVGINVHVRQEEQEEAELQAVEE